MDINEIIQLAAISLISVVFAIYVTERFRIMRQIKTLKSADFEASMHNNQIIDCRKKQDYKQSHIMGSRNIPLESMKNASTLLHKNKPIYLYANDTHKARKAANELFKLEYRELFVLKGGFKNWNGKIKETK